MALIFPISGVVFCKGSSMLLLPPFSFGCWLALNFFRDLVLVVTCLRGSMTKCSIVQIRAMRPYRTKAADRLRPEPVLPGAARRPLVGSERNSVRADRSQVNLAANYILLMKLTTASRARSLAKQRKDKPRKKRQV